jgi:riboflavin kinase/FMN adenylyltransferase
MPIHVIPWHDMPPSSCQGGAVAIGNFDGVHRGHAALLDELRRAAHAVRGPAVALTFDPHPLQLLRPAEFLPQLTTLEDRAENLLTAGADQVLVLKVDWGLLRLGAGEFFDQIIRERLHARALVEGFNFAFGRNREGDVGMLTKLCEQHNLILQIVPPLLADGVPVSSSRVRTCLTSGAVRKAADLLGRPYRLRGIVGTGQRRGQGLGFPTANLEELRTVVPGNGVYAVRALVNDEIWPGAANIGPNPTFGEDARKVEVHLIGFEGDLYGRPLAVDFLDRLRDTRPFASVSELVDQLKRDVHQASRIAGSAL